MESSRAFIRSTSHTQTTKPNRFDLVFIAQTCIHIYKMRVREKKMEQTRGWALHIHMYILRYKINICICININTHTQRYSMFEIYNK